MPPEEGEAGVGYYRWELPGNRTEVPASEAMVSGKQRTEPLSKCQDKCNLNGLCFTFTEQANPAPTCSCHRGFTVGCLAAGRQQARPQAPTPAAALPSLPAAPQGVACEVEENACFNKCNGEAGPGRA